MSKANRFRFRAWEQFDDGSGRMHKWTGMYDLCYTMDGKFSIHVAEKEAERKDHP